MATSARKEMIKHMGSLRIYRALRHAIPAAEVNSYELGDQVLVLREMQVNNRIEKGLVRKYQTPDQLARIPSDPRASRKEMTDAKRKEIQELLERETFKVLLREEVPTDANALPGRFVIAIKSTEDWKINTTDPVSRSPLRLLRVEFGRHPSLYPVLLPLMRDVYITNHLSEFELEAHQCLKLLKPLYGLCESGDLWHSTIDEHHRLDLGMEATRSDTALYTLLSNSKLIRLSGGYVGDLLRADTPAFRKPSQLTHEKFDMGADDSPPCAFSSFLLSRDRDGNLLLHQKLYLKQLDPSPRFDILFVSLHAHAPRMAV
eukprot:IDg4844t1